MQENSKPQNVHSVVLGELVKGMSIEINKPDFLFNFLTRGKERDGLWSITKRCDIEDPEIEDNIKEYRLTIRLSVEDKKHVYGREEGKNIKTVNESIKE